MKFSYAEPQCQALKAAPLDALIAELVLRALEPAALEASLALAADLEAERAVLDRQWQQRLVPARLQFGRHESVRRIGGVVLSEGAIGRVTRRFQIAQERFASSISMSRLGFFLLRSPPRPHQARRPSEARSRSHRRPANRRKRCNAARRCRVVPDGRHSAGCCASSRCSGPSAYARSVGNGRDPRAVRPHAWEHHDGGWWARCRSSSCGSPQRTPNPHILHARGASTQASPRAACHGASNGRRCCHSAPRRSSYHRHRRHRRPGLRSSGGGSHSGGGAR